MRKLIALLILLLLLSVLKSDAITIDEDLTVVFNKEKCIGSTCSACVDACPARAIKSVKQSNSELAAGKAR